MTERELIECALAEVRALRTDVAGIRATMNRLAPALRLNRNDLADLERLMPPLVSCFDAAAFTSREALDHPALREHLRQWTAKSFGKFLARVRDVPVGGVWLERVGSEAHVTVWKIARPWISGFNGDFKAA